MENSKKIANFLMELAGAKTTARTGWQRIGIKNPESLADHSALSAQIAYVLAVMEGADPERAAALSLFHDLAELRLGDSNWVARVYSSGEKGDFEEKRAETDQTDGLPFGGELEGLLSEAKEKKTKEAIIAKDADYLDMAIQAKYYAENGNQKALLWLKSVKNHFSTRSAQELCFLIENTGIEEWWTDIEDIRKKF